MSTFRRVSYVSILTRAIRDCEASVEEYTQSVSEWERLGRHTEAIFCHDNILKPIEEELATLKHLYFVETGTLYDE